MDQKDKSISEILAAHADPGTGADAEEQDEGDVEGKRLSDAAFDAIKQGDRDAFHEALEGFVAHCAGEDYSGGDESPEPSPGPEKGRPSIAVILGGKH